MEKVNGDENLIVTDIDGFKYAPDSSGTLDDHAILTGVDNDKAMVRICILNMILHGVEKFNIEYRNSLRNEYPYSDQKYDLILSNPPFGLKDREGHYYSDNGFTTSELQFLEKSISLLKNNGRAVIIVPEGILSNSATQFQRARQMLLEQTRLEAVISLPSGTFNPYTAGKSAILVLQKGKRTESVWFYELESDGYSKDKDRRRTKGEPLTTAVEYYRDRHTKQPNRTEPFFFVPIQEIEAQNWNISFSTYKEFNYSKQQVTEPKEIISELLKQEDIILAELKKLADSIK